MPSIIPEKVLSLAHYFDSFVKVHIPKLIDLYKATKSDGINSFQEDIDKVVHQLAGSFHGFLSTTFSDVSFPGGFVTPENFLKEVVFFKDWLSEDVKPRVKRKQKEALYYSIYASQLMKFIEDYITISNMIVEDLNTVLKVPDITSIFDQIAHGFSAMQSQLQNRYNKRETLKINDEYDVQNLYCSVLKLFIENVKLEEPTSSLGGKKPRVDAFLPDFGVMIDFKKTNERLLDKQLTEQLGEDCLLYQADLRCKYIYFFVYDCDRFLRNAVGIKKDIEAIELSRKGSPIIIRCHIVH